MLPVAAVLRLCVTRAMPALPPAVEAAVAGHWADAVAARPLFNGRVFCADTVTAERIEGHWTEYRRAAAQMREPGLFEVLGIRSLSVCGVLVGPDGVAVGRRAAGSVYEAGLWQLPPAGSVDFGAAEGEGASWRRAILAELEEELGIGAADVADMRPLCLVLHPSGVLDLGVRIDTGLTGAAVLARHRASGDREYERLLVAPWQEVAGRVAGLGGRMVPSSGAFLLHAFGDAA